MITAGTAINEAIKIIRASGAEPAGVLVALDREEIGNQNRISAVRELEENVGIPVRCIVSLTDLVNHLKENSELSEHLLSVVSYRNRYGITLE